MKFASDDQGGHTFPVLWVKKGASCSISAYKQTGTKKKEISQVIVKPQLLPE